MEEQEFYAGEEYRPLMPDGIWEAECTGYNTGYYHRTRKLFLNFKLVGEGPYNGTELFMSFNMPYDGYIATGSKYYKTWAKVTGKKPSRNAKMSPRLFLNKLYRIRTRTVRPKDGGEELPRQFNYSIVDSIKDVLF